MPGGRDFDVRLYTPVAAGGTPPVVTVPANGGSGTNYTTPASLPFAIPAGTYVAATLTKTSGANSVGGQTDNLATASGNVTTAPNSNGAGVGYGFSIAFSPAMIADINTAAGGTLSVAWTVSAGSSTANGASWALTLSPTPLPAGWERAELPDFEVTAVDWEVLERGGFGNGHVQIACNWEKHLLLGTERVDIWDQLGITLLYRGDVRLPESHLEMLEMKDLALYGRVAASGDWLIGRRYVYPTLSDLSVVATDLFNDVVKSFDATAVTDIQATGAFVQPGELLDWAGTSLASAMDALIQRAPSQAIWGWDTVADPAGGLVPVNRFYLRPRAQVNKYDYSAGGSVSALVYPVDTTAIVNKIHVIGGPALQPNLSNNGGFERPVAPDEHHGNLLLDGTFEGSVFSYTRFLGVVTGGSGTNAHWAFLNDASLKDTAHPGGGQSNPNDGRWWVSLDQNTETVQQAIAIDHTKILRGCAWIRRGTVGTAATCNLFLDAIDAGGTVLGTVGHPSNPVDPGLLATSLADSLYQRLTWDADFTSGTYATCTQVRLRVVGLSGTNNNDGVYVDTCGVWYRDVVVQTAWITSQSSTTSNPSGPVSPAPTVDWVHKPSSSGDSTAPIQGGYCVRMIGAPASGGWVELQQELYAKATGKRFQTYSALVQFRVPDGAADATVTVGCYAYNSDGSLWAVLEGDFFVGGSDGNWHTAFVTISVQDADSDLQPFVRQYSTGTVYLDGFMLVVGPVPLECTEKGDCNFWEGASYEWVVDTDNTSLSLAALPAASIATYGVRSKEEDQPLVVDRPSAVAFAEGYFAANAVARCQGRITIANDERAVGLDGLVRVHNLPGEAGGAAPADQALVPVRVRWQYSAAGSVVDVDVNNDRPNMALLFLQEAGSQNSAAASQRAAAAAAGGAGSGGNSGSGPFNNGGAGYSTGAASVAGVVRIAGDPQSISAQTYFKPGSDEVILGVQREASGQTASLMEWYDETGTVLSKVLPSGGLQAPTLKATGLTGATQASRLVGATASGAPVAGTFATGDLVIDQTGTVWICTAGGTPGTWAKPGGGASSRQTASVTTASLAAGATEALTVALAKGYKLVHVTASAAARVRLYGASSYRTADASRAIGTDPTAGSENGIICDVALGYLSSPLSWDMSPEALGSNLDGTVTTTAYYAITNLGAGAAALTVSFVFVPLES